MEFFRTTTSKKIPKIVEICESVHSVCRVKEIEAIAKVLNEKSKLKKIYIQVNVSSEQSKSGASPNEVSELLASAHKNKILHLVEGFMCVPAPLEDIGENALRDQFRLLKDLRDKNFPKGKLNMGMSDDYKIAIEEGSNLIRLGTLLFGQRK